MDVVAVEALNARRDTDAAMVDEVEQLPFPQQQSLRVAASSDRVRPDGTSMGVEWRTSSAGSHRGA
jgi:hypothetical protein